MKEYFYLSDYLTKSNQNNTNCSFGDHRKVAIAKIYNSFQVDIVGFIESY